VTAVRDLLPGDFDDLLAIAGIYLSTLEVSENEELFQAACSTDVDRTIGLGVDAIEGGRSDGDRLGLFGFLVGTEVPAGSSLDDQFNRPTPITTDAAAMVLQHLYVRPEHISDGYGSALLSAALEIATDRGIEAVYAEAWIRPNEPDAVRLLEDYGFERRYHDPDYWAHEGFVANEVPCPTHGHKYVHCPCEGAVYALRGFPTGNEASTRLRVTHRHSTIDATG